jgi:hypothetical protein
MTADGCDDTWRATARRFLYNAQQNTPALSSHFELMDRLVLNFLSA